MCRTCDSNVKIEINDKIRMSSRTQSISLNFTEDIIYLSLVWGICEVCDEEKILLRTTL